MNYQYMPIFPDEPINLIENNCLKAINQIKEEYSTQRYRFPKLKPYKSEPFLFEKARLNKKLITSIDNQSDSIQQGKRYRKETYQLHIQPKKEEEPLPLIMFKSKKPIKYPNYSIKKYSKNKNGDESNLKSKNSQSLLILRHQQLEQMKNVQRLIIDVLQKQSEKLDHHFDKLQDEFSQS